MQIKLPQTLWFPVIAGLSFALASDHFDIFGRTSLKFLPVLAMCGLTALYLLVDRFRVSYLSAPAVAFFALFLFALPGLIYGKINEYAAGLASSLGLILTVLAAQCVPARQLSFDASAYLRFFERLSVFFVIWSILATLVSRFIDPSLVPKFHERAFLVPPAAVSFFLSKRWKSFVLYGFIMILAVLVDKRTTILLVYGFTFFGLILSRFSRASRSAVLLGSVFVAPFTYSVIKELSYYFKVVYGEQASDNTEFRERLWERGWEQFMESPIVGNFFTEGGAYDLMDLKLRSEEGIVLAGAPLHNDYIEFLASGGIIGFSLFFAGIFGCAIVSYMNADTYKQLGYQNDSMLSYLLFIAMISVMLTIVANPCMNNPQNGFFVYMLCAIAVLTDRKLKVIKASLRGRRY